MTISAPLAHKSPSKTSLWFFTTLAVQLVLGGMILVGLFHLGFWKTTVLEICKFVFVLPKAFQLRRASWEHNTPATVAPLLADVILISYDLQFGNGR